MISYKGKLSILVALPLFGQLVATLDIPGLQAEVAALLAATVTFTPPSIVGVLAVVAAIGAAIQAGFQPPSFDFKANLLVKLGLLKAKLELILKLTDLLTGGSVRLYEYEGQSSGFGGQLGTTLAGADPDGGIPPAQPIFAVLLVAEASTSGEVTLKAIRSGV